MGTDHVVSRRTWGIAAAGILVSVVCLALIRRSIGTDTEAFYGNLPSILTGAAASITALWAAMHFDRSEGFRRQWLLIGLGMSAIFAGDAIFAYLEVVAHKEVPFPSIADPFYLVSFLLFGGGLLLTLLSFRRSLSIMAPLTVSFVTCALATVALWPSIFWPIITDAEAGSFEKLLTIWYPIGDLWLLAFPALALAIALSRLGGGRLAWPWWALVVGFSGIALSDTLFALMSNDGTYASGSTIDAGWWFGYTAVAVAASLLVDVQRPIRRGGAS